MDELFHEHWQQTFFAKKLKKNKMEKLMLIYFEKFDT
jgi:hypothetical protein